MTEGAASKRPTIWEVAKLAGVSHQTVSRFLRRDAGMKESTKQRIKGAIVELGYRPNLVARALRDRRTGRVAILLPAGTSVSSVGILTGATAAAHDAGFAVESVTLREPWQDQAERILALSDSGLYEGILSLTPLPPDITEAGTAPVVVSPAYDDHMRGIDKLADASPIVELIERLAELGHRRFLHLAGGYTHMTAHMRRQTYEKTLDRLGLDSYGVADCDWSPEAARVAVAGLPSDSGVTAVIGANDALAAGAIRGAWERGWRVPDDLSVTGWDNDLVAAILPPTITTVAVDYERFGTRAMARLLAVLAGRPEPTDEDSPSQVLWRESTGPAPRR